MKQKTTYFTELAGSGWLLVGLFGLLFYLLCFLYSRHYVGASRAGDMLGVYWAASLLLFVAKMSKEFPSLYRATLRRMRLYRAWTWFLVWHVGWTVTAVTVLYFMLVDYRRNVEVSLSSYSAKLLLGTYGCSLFYAVVLGTMRCNWVASMRDTRCFKR